MKKSILLIALVSVLSLKSIAQSSENKDALFALNTSSAINTSSIENASDCANSNEAKEEVKAHYAFNTKLTLNKPKGTFKLVINSPVQGYAIVNITDMIGRKVMSTKTNVSIGANDKEFDIEQFSSGLYNVQVITNSTTKSLRIML